MHVAEYKFANELYWSVKGHLIPFEWTEDQVTIIKESYFKRIWGNHESMTSEHMSGFEEAWQKRLDVLPEWIELC